MPSFSFPSKTFVLGEYAVLESGSALLLAHEPMFQARIGKSLPNFAANSPAGKAFKKFGPVGLDFLDPHEGRGGFGGSGAEFLAVVAAHEGKPGNPEFAWKAYDLYRELGCAGSGADILCQGATSTTAFVSIDIPNRGLETFLPKKLGVELRLFHTGEKLATHDHLAQKFLLSDKLARITREGESALRGGHPGAFAHAIANYAALLAELNLVAPHTAAALAGSPGPGILAAKGCGALGSDVILVCCEPKASTKAWAEEHSLVEVAKVPI